MAVDVIKIYCLILIFFKRLHTAGKNSSQRFTQGYVLLLFLQITVIKLRLWPNGTHWLVSNAPFSAFWQRGGQAHGMCSLTHLLQQAESTEMGRLSRFSSCDWRVPKCFRATEVLTSLVQFSSLSLLNKISFPIWPRRLE